VAKIRQRVEDSNGESFWATYEVAGVPPGYIEIAPGIYQQANIQSLSGRECDLGLFYNSDGTWSLGQSRVTIEYDPETQGSKIQIEQDGLRVELDLSNGAAHQRACNFIESIQSFLESTPSLDMIQKKDKERASQDRLERERDLEL